MILNPIDIREIQNTCFDICEYIYIFYIIYVYNLLDTRDIVRVLFVTFVREKTVPFRM